MMYILSLISAFLGIVCLIRYKSLSQSITGLYVRKSPKVFGIPFDWESPKYRIIVKIVVILFGIFLLIMAFHFAFGTIYIGSAQPDGASHNVSSTGNYSK